MKLVTNYLKNVTKSVAYVAADIAKNDLAPNMTDFVDSNKDFIKATYATLKNPAIAVRRSVSALQKSKVYQALDYGVRNTFEDLRTGNFYNKEREDRDQLKLAGLGDFSDWDDLSEFGIDDDWESKLEGGGSEKSEVTAGDIKIVDAIEGSNAAATSATINAIIASSEAQTKYSRANTGMIYMQNERLFGGLHKDLTALNETLVSLHKLTSTGLQNIDKNTADYFTAELKLSTERNAMLKEMLEMQRQYYKSAIDKDREASKGSSSRMRWGDINSGGLPNFENYFKNVKKNVSEELSMFGISGFSDDSNMLAAFMTSPLQYALKGIMGGLIPAMVKDATKELDNTFSSIFANIIGKLSNRSDDYDLMGFISRFLGVNTRVNSNINTGKYEKGPVPFDGITRKAIIDVIPSYLRRIEAHISGNPEQTYDYNSGKWVNMKSVKEKFNDLHKSAVRQGTRDLSSAMDPKLKEIRNRFTDSDELDDFNEAVEEFYEYLYNNNGQFNPSKNARENGISSSKYPHLSKQRNYNLIRGSYDIIGRGSVQYRGGTKSVHKVSTKMGVAKSVLDAKDSEERRYRELETSGTSTMSQLKSSLGVDMHGKWSGKSFKQDKGGLFVQDKLGNSVFDYLREINKELRWQRQTGFENIFGILRNMSGGNGGGGPNNLQGNNGSATQQGNGFTPINLQHPGIILPNGAVHPTSSASSAPNPNGYTLYSQTRRALNDAAFNSIDLESQAHREARQNAEKAKQRYKDETKAKALKIISEGGGADLSQVDDNDVASYMLYLKRLFLEQNSEELKEQIEDENLGAASEFFEKYFFQTNVKSIKDVRRAAERAAQQRQHQDQLDQKEKSFLSSLANKISKTGSLTGGIIGASGDFFTNLLYTADKAIYEMMFKSELRNTEDASVRYSGFMDMISHKISDTFDKVKTFFKDNALDPIKKWLGIDDTFKDRFADEAKRIGSGFWDRFTNVNKEIYGPGVNQFLTDLGLKNRETTAQKKRREGRESAASAYDDLKNITNLYDPRFLEICREFGVNITEYDGNFDAAVAEVKKKVLQRFYKNTKRFKEVDNSDQVNKAILANQENLKELRSVAEEFGITLPEKDDDPAAVISAFTQGMSGFKSLVRGFDSTDSKKFRATNDAKLASKYLSDTQKAMISSTTRNARNDIIRKTTTGVAASSVEKARALGFKDNDGERDKRVAMLKALNPNLSDEDINALDTDEKLADSYISQFTSALDTAKASGADVVSIAESLGFKGDRESKIKILKKLDPKISSWDLKNLDTDKKLAERFLKLQRRKYKRANAMRDEQAGGADAVAEAERLGFKGTREQKIAMLKQLNPDLKSSHIDKLDSDEKLALNFLRLQRKNFATGTFGKPFMGDTMLSKGELLFNDDGISRVKKTDAYRLDKPTHILNSEDSFDLLEASGYPKNKLGVKSTIQQDLGREKLKEKALFGISKHASGTVQVSENGNASIDPKAILSEIKGAIPEGAAGGLIGLLAPALLGVSLGPIGAIVGASASVLHKSTALQETFFGKKDAAGKFDGSGLVNGKIIEVVQKYAPTMLKYGLAGILPSMIIPGGGILRGLLLGAGAGFMKASDMSARNLFGDGSLLNTKNKNLLKKLGLGGLKGGAIGGVLGLAGKMALGLSGPWGIVGATVLGSAIGMAKNTDEFKNSLFGTEDNSGIRHGGLLEEISEMFAPFREAMANLSDSIQKTVQQNIIKPLQEFLNPFIHGLPRLLTAPLRKFSSWMEKKFAKPMSQFLRTKILDPAKNLFAPVTKFIGKVGYGITAPIRGLGAIGNRMRKNQILDATADDMTAADRINFMNDKFANTRAKSKYDAGIGNFDLALRDLGTKKFTIKQGEQFRNDLYAVIDTNAGLNKARRKQEKEIGSALTKAFGGNISGKVINQAEKAIQDGHPEKVAGILKKAAISKKGGMTSEQFDDLMNGAVTKDGRSLNDMLKRRQTLQDRLNHFNSLTDEEKAQNQAALSERFKKMGIDLDFSDRDQIRKYAKYLDTELEDRALNPDEEREALNEENAKNVSQLAKDLHTILEKGIKIASGQDYEDMEPELNPDGSEKKDEHGNTIYKKVTKNEKNVVAQDEKGNIITDADGKPVYQTEAEKAIDKASQNTAKDMSREQADRADEVLRRAGLDPSKVSDSAKAHLGTAGTYSSFVTHIPFIGKHFKGKVGNGENIDAKSLLSNGKKGVAITEGELNVSDGNIERIKEIKSLGADFVLKERKDIISYINGLTLERYNWLRKALKKKHVKAWIAGNMLSLNDVKLLSDYSIDLKKLNNRCAQALRDNMPFYSLEQLYDADDLDRLHHEMKNPKPSQDQANTNTPEQTVSNTPEQDAAASVINDLTGNTEQVASAEPAEQTEDTTEEIPTHSLGTAILGGLGSLAGKAITGTVSLAARGVTGLAKLAGKGVVGAARGIGRGISNGISSLTSGSSSSGGASVAGAASGEAAAQEAVANATNNGGSGMFDETDKPGDGRDVVQFNSDDPNSFGLVKRDSSGNVEPDTSDSRTKTIIKGMEKAKELKEKAQNAALKTASVIKDAFDVSDDPQAKKGKLNWWKLLIVGGLLWKSGILTKLFEGIVKPLWTNLIYPWWTETAWPGIKGLIFGNPEKGIKGFIPWLKEKWEDPIKPWLLGIWEDHLKPWLSDTLLPWITDTAIPGLVGVIGDAIKGALGFGDSSSPSDTVRVIQDGLGTALDFGVSNKNNVRGSTTTDYKDMQQGALHDVDGRTLTAEDIENGNYVKIYNSEGVEGTIDSETGTIKFKDPSRPGSNFVDVTGNAAVHAFAQGSHGIGTRLMTGYGLVGKGLTRTPGGVFSIPAKLKGWSMRGTSSITGKAGKAGDRFGAWLYSHGDKAKQQVLLEQQQTVLEAQNQLLNKHPSSVQSGMNADDLISKYGNGLSSPAGKEVAEETGEKVATETVEKAIGKEAAEETVEKAVKEGVEETGEKIAAETVETVAKTTASNVDDIALKATASETIEHGTTQIANEVVENVVGESSEAAIKQGLSSKIMTAIVNAVDKLFDNSTVLQHLEKAANVMANTGPAKWIAKLKDRVISIFKKGAPEAVEKAGASEARQAVSRINILLTVAQLVADFLIGMDQVEQILGVSKVEGTLGIVEAVVAGIVNALCNLTIIFAIFPGTNWLTRGILELCGDDLAERQAEAEAEYQEYVAKTGSTLTKEEYLKKEKSVSGWASVAIKQKAEVAMDNAETKAANSQIDRINKEAAKKNADYIEEYKENAKEWIAAGVYTEEQLAEDIKQLENPISNERASEIIDQAKAGSWGLMDTVTYGGEWVGDKTGKGIGWLYDKFSGNSKKRKEIEEKINSGSSSTSGGEWVGDKTGKGIGWLYDKFSGNSKKRKEIEEKINSGSSSTSETKVVQASIGNALSDNNASANQWVTVSNPLAAGNSEEVVEMNDDELAKVLLTDSSTENKASVNAANIVGSGTGLGGLFAKALSAISGSKNKGKIVAADAADIISTDAELGVENIMDKALSATSNYVDYEEASEGITDIIGTGAEAGFENIMTHTIEPWLKDTAVPWIESEGLPKVKTMLVEALKEYGEWQFSEIKSFIKDLLGSGKRKIAEKAVNIGKAVKVNGTTALDAVKSKANIVDGIFSTDKVNGTKLKDAGNKMMDIVKSGDLSALTKYKISGDEDSSGITSVVSGSLKTMLSGPTLFTKAFSFIGDELDNVVTAIGETNIEKDEKIISSAENGDISIFSSDYWSQSKEAMADNSLSGIFQKAMSSVTKIAHAPALLFRQLVGIMIDSLSNMSEYLSEKMAESGIADINGDGTVTASNSGSTTNTSTGTSNYIRQDGSIVQSTTTGSASVNNSTSNSRAIKGSNGKKKGVISRIFDKVFGRGTTEAQYGMGYSKQIDPLISSIRYNSCGDSDYQTIGNSGCGPAAAVNVMEAMYGRGSENIVSAARYAIKRGYKEKNGGTTPRFFKDYFSKNGYSSQTTSSKSQLMKNIRSGHPTVLMGKDSGGTSRNTPYGKSPHYVTATGIDRKGHVIIQDPESKYDNQLYSMKDVMRKTSFGVSAFGKSYGMGKGSNQYTYNKYGRGKFGRGSKKIIFVGDSRFVQMYNYRFKGSKDHYVNVTDEDGNVWSVYGGMGLDWMKNTGIPEIESELDKNTALCINMGINGIQDSSVDSTIDAYVSYYNSKIDDWTKKGAEVYFVSVNPVGTSGGSDNYNGFIHNSTVKKFNKGVKAGVSSKMGYIDTYGAIINNYKSSDNLHYDSDTSDAIYNAIVNGVGSGGSDSGDNDSIGVAGKSGGNRRNARVLHIDAEYQDAERSIASSISNYLAENVSYDYSDSSYVGNMSPSSSSSSSSDSSSSSSSKDSSSSSDKDSDKDTSAKGTMSITKSKINAATKTKSFNPRKYNKKPKTKKWGKGTERYKPMAKYGTGEYGYSKSRYGRGVTIIEGKTCYDADDPLSILEGQYQQITLNGKKVVVRRAPHNPFEPHSTYYRELQDKIMTALSYKTVKARDSSMLKAFQYIVKHKDKILDSYKNTQDYRNFALRYGLTDYTYHNDKADDTTDEVEEEEEETEDTSSSSSSSSSSDSSSSDTSGDTIGSFLSNVLADSKVGQVLNSFISFSNGSSSDEGEDSGNSNGYSGTVLDGSDARTKTWNYFTKKGYSKAAVSGIMGNIEKETFQESEPGVFPGDGDAVATTEWKWSGDGTGKSTVAGDPGGGGIIQWTPWNTNTLGPYCKEKTGDEKAWMKDLGIQLDCLHEKNMPNIGTGNSYSLPGAGLSSNLVSSREEYMKMTDPEKAARQFQAGIERPNNAYAHTDRRVAAAKWFYDNMEKIKKSSKSSKSGTGALFSLPGGFGSFRPGRYGRGVTIIEGKTCYDADDPLSILEGQYQQITLNGKKVVVMRPPHNPFELNSTCYRELQDKIMTALSYKTVKARNSSMHKAYEYIVKHKDKILDSYKNTQDYRNFALRYGLTDYTYHNDKVTDEVEEEEEETEETSSSSSSSSSSDSSSSDVAGDTIGSFLSNVLADSKVGQVLNSFISFSNGSSSSSSGSSGSKGSNITGSGTAADMVKIAMKEYEEGNEGDNNKYNTWMWGEGSTLPWCAAFVAWCADQAGVSTDIIPKSGGCIAMAEGILEGGGKQLDDPKDAKPGDIIFYGTRGGYSHVGIVRDYDSKSGFLRTVEGNTGYSKGYGEVGIHDNVGLTGIDIDRPAYNDNSSKKSSKKDKSDSDSSKKSSKKDKSDSDSSGSGSLFGMGTFGTGDSHEDKPLARYGTFKESIYGTGTNDNTYKAPHTNLQDIKKTIRNGDGSTRKIVYSGMDRELNRIYKSASRPTVHTQTFGLGTSEEVNVQPTAVLNNSRVVDNSALISTIIKILYTIADNTDKLNTIVAILNNKLGANISPEDISNSSNKQTLKSKLHQSLNAAASTATSKLNSYADSVGDASLNTIIQAMNAIAAE